MLGGGLLLRQAAPYTAAALGADTAAVQAVLAGDRRNWPCGNCEAIDCVSHLFNMQRVCFGFCRSPAARQSASGHHAGDCSQHHSHQAGTARCLARLCSSHRRIKSPGMSAPQTGFTSGGAKFYGCVCIVEVRFTCCRACVVRYLPHRRCRCSRPLHPTTCCGWRRSLAFQRRCCFVAPSSQRCPPTGETSFA